MADGGTPNDASILKPTLQIGVRGIAQILKVYQAGTDEVRKLLTQECEVIFECKVCRNLFRGLPNLIAHKRAYCVKEYVDQRKDFPNFYSSDIVTVVPEAPKTKDGSELSRLFIEPVPFPADSDENAKGISITNLVPMLSPSGKSTWLKPKNVDAKQNSASTKNVEEEKHDGENEGDENSSNVSKIIPARDRETLTCSACSKKFTTLKSLLKHYNHLHLGQQTLYKCSLCPSVFSYTRSIRRHLEKKHKKEPGEISKLMKMIVRKATKVTRNIESSPPSPPEKSVSKTAAKFTNSGNLEVAGTEAKSNSNPEESASMTAQITVDPATPAQVKEPEECNVLKERLTCPDCGKEFEKRSILDRHMKVCADYAKIAVTFDMSLVKGMQHLATNYGSSIHEKSGNEEAETSPGKKNRRKAAPCRLLNTDIDSDVDSDARSVLSDKSSKVPALDAMPKLQPVEPLVAEHSEMISRPSGCKVGTADERLAKQAKLSNIETVLQFLKNPKKRSIMSLVSEDDGSEANTEKEMQPPTLEREDITIEKDANKSEVRKEDSKQIDSYIEAPRSPRSRSLSSPRKVQESPSEKPKKLQVPSPPPRTRSASESKTMTRKSGDSLSDKSDANSNVIQDSSKIGSPKKETRSAADTVNVVKPSKESQESVAEVDDSGDRGRAGRASRKRQRSASEERTVGPAKRRDEDTELEEPDDGADNSRVNKRAPRYASNFTTRRRQSMLEDILASVQEGDGKSKTVSGRRNSEPVAEETKSKTNTVSASSSGNVKDNAKSSEAVGAKNEKPSPKKTKSNDGPSEVDCDEGGVLRCMLMDADTAPKGRRRGALLPSHIAEHVNYEEKICRKCSKNFTSVTELISHISKAHMNMKRYRCSLCSVEGMYFSEITRHIARTHRRAFRANHKIEWLSMCVKPINISSE